ncbi:phage protein NinX family protein [Providencia alcalifaciens]|uniref:phage protein NinX family protein n=1 Tax=Providencia alcalifaciens TaxID=126385 RepID=UPI00055AF8C5|nr:phage protein NinX family protein [Providencia alcalifaciens]
MNKHTGLSDFEINRRIAEMDTKNRYVYFEKEQTIFRKFNNGQTQKFNPCNYPADAMPIILENGISMVRVNNTWSARQFNNHCIEINGDNYYRIAMEVYLLMNGK